MHIQYLMILFLSYNAFSLNKISSNLTSKTTPDYYNTITILNIWHNAIFTNSFRRSSSDKHSSFSFFSFIFICWFRFFFCFFSFHFLVIIFILWDSQKISLHLLHQSVGIREKVDIPFFTGRFLNSFCKNIYFLYKLML